MSKKLYFLILLLTGFAGFAVTPPVIQQPTNLTVCDDNNDGTAVFDLTPKIAEVLGALNPNLYTVTFHETATDAEFGSNPLMPLNSFVNISPFNQFIYVRVVENSTGDYSLSGFQLIVNPTITGSITTPSGIICGTPTVMLQASGGSGFYTFTVRVNGGVITTVNANETGFVVMQLPAGFPTYDVELLEVQSNSGGSDCSVIGTDLVHLEVHALPVAGPASDLIVEDIPYDGIGIFDLTSNESALANGVPGLSIMYYTTQANADSGVAPIANPTAFAGTNGQRIWARVEDISTGCFGIGSFYLYLTNPDIVFIPNSNFKNTLLMASASNEIAKDLSNNYAAVDTNGDGEIQYTEASNISLLNVENRSITNLTGLQAFINLTSLNINRNLVTGVNTPALPLLTNLSASQCNIYTLDLSNNPNLTQINCSYNNLTTVDFSPCPLLTDVRVQNNILTSVNLTGLSALEVFWASDNHLASLDTSGLTSITSMFIGANSITSLSLEGLTMLEELHCDENQIDALDTADCPNLQNLTCAANQMTSLDVSQSPLLTNLDCSVNNFENLDFGSNTALCTLNCSINASLVTINIKNGVDSCYVNYMFSEITNVLQQFCCDDNEVGYFRNYFLTNMGVDVNVNSYCSFIPGGDYNTIKGKITFDGNNNGCDAGDSVQPNIRVNIFDGTNSGAAFTNSTGEYLFYTQAGTFSYYPSLENPTWFTISPNLTSTFFNDNNHNVDIVDYCVTPNGSHPDLEIVIAPLTTARPGFNALYKIVIRNKGNQTISQANGINVSYDASQLDFLSADNVPSSVGTGTLSWNFANLAPFESKSIIMTMRVHAPTEVPNEVNNGDILTFNTTVNPTAGDENPGDNAFQFNQTVVGSFDPNEIVCLEGNIVSPIEIGNYLHYTINFENTGTADAENIVVRDVIDTTQFDLSSLQLLNSSASVTTRLVGNVAEFIFPSINLHSGGHGNILIKIRSNTSLVTGDSVTKRASIYFDYNFPVLTEPENTIFQSLSNPDVEVDASISVYPNPTKGNVNISCSNAIKSIELYDIQGRILQTNLVDGNEASIDISGQSKGVYFLRVLSDNGMKVQKIVKE